MLADDVHIEQIRTALWKGREYGRAAVLVGAGFSRNARPARASAQPFPLWGDLARILIDQLYPASSSPEWIRNTATRQAESTSGALRLAQEFEAAHGRQRLDQLIRDSVADTDWVAGKVHRLLMELPWSDVFTTNYDTLLERAALLAYERKYEIVYTMAQIPSATRPRIVKLHGSFPAISPFILTEEDFRTYPRHFAPFVNLVQQAMTENVFCLLGFSGDDPNFLYWSGWVRDHLGKSAPTIYLCGLLDLNAPKRQLLHERRVTPIDLSPLFPRHSYPDPQERHSLAMEWFLLTLEAGRPLDPLLWPNRTSKEGTTPSSSLPGLLSPAVVKPQKERLSPEGMPGLQPILDETKSWAVNRGLYPGWLVAPRPTRESLLLFTKGWIRPIVINAPAIEAQERLRMLEELNWRLEVALVPLFPDVVKVNEACLTAIQPFTEGIGLPEPELRLGERNVDKLRWSEIREQWFALGFALLRYYREERTQDKFIEWADRLGPLVQQDPSLHARLCYEKCLSSLGQMDVAATREALHLWTGEANDPIWSIRKAAVLTELGELSGAARLAEGALHLIRIQATGPGDISALSREGWALLLVRGLTNERWFRGRLQRSTQGELQDHSGRWVYLARFRCDPWADLDYFDGILGGDAPSGGPTSCGAQAFDPVLTTSPTVLRGKTA